MSARQKTKSSEARGSSRRLTVTFKDPAAVNLLDSLEKLIAVADAAFHPGGSFVYPRKLENIPEVVRQLQPFLGRTKVVRYPFWKCVKAVDERRKKLGLVDTLNRMVDRATSVQPGPLFRLLTERDNGTLSAQESDALLALDRQLEVRPDNPPQNLKMYRSLFERVCSKEYDERNERLKRRVPETLVRGAFEDMLDYAAYLDFCEQHFRWIERYQKGLEDLFGLLIEFNSDHFYRMINRVLYGSTPKEASEKEWHRKASLRGCVIRHRAGAKATPRQKPGGQTGS